MIRGVKRVVLLVPFWPRPAWLGRSGRHAQLPLAGDEPAMATASRHSKRSTAKPKTGPRIVVRDTTPRQDRHHLPAVRLHGCRLEAPVWSPDGSTLALISSDPKAGVATVYVLRDGKMTRGASVKGVANSVRWSPDGRQMAFLATVGAKKLTGAVEAGARQVGEIGVAEHEDEQRIAWSRQRRRLRLVSPADTFVYEYDWTPDGKGFVVTSAKGNGDNNWWIATLGHVDATSGKLRVLAAPKMQMNMPHVSPDGRTVAFIGGLMSDFGSVGGDVYTVSMDGGQPVDVTPGYKGTFNGIAWRGKEVMASAGRRRCRRRRHRPGRAQHAHPVEGAGDGRSLARRPLRVQRRRQGRGLGARGFRRTRRASSPAACRN
jgi:Tol biopolymer transport system component